MNSKFPLLLTSSTEDNRFATPVIFSGLSGYPNKKKIEAAGEGYQKFLRVYYNLQDKEIQPTTSSEEVFTKEQEEVYTKKVKVGGKKAKKDHFEEDYYVLLGLEKLRYKATQDDIRRAYRQAVLKYHPDKKTIDVTRRTEDEDTVFKQITKAYDVLYSPSSRRTYDSQEKFDDTYPTNIQLHDLTKSLEENFFLTYGEVFERFSKWSTKVPVPQLGDFNNTPYEEVEEFYRFWRYFESWRDFSYEDEHDLTEADNREEKRWMEKQNEKARNKRKKEETIRIRNLTEIAYKLDPRIQRKNRQDKDEKERQKSAKLDKERKEREEKEQKVEEERLKKEQEEQKRQEEAAQVRRQRDKEKKALRKERARIRTLSQKYVDIPPEQVELLCSELDTEPLQSLCNDMEKSDATAKGLLEKAIASLLESKRKEEEEHKLKSAVLEAKRDIDTGTKKNPWTDDEISNLAKGIAKFPAGLTERYKIIANFIGTRTEKEVMAKLKELKDNDELLNERGRNDGTNAFQRFKKVTKESVIDSPLTSSIERETDTKSIPIESNDESDTPTSTYSEKEATKTPKSETKKVKFANEPTTSTIATNKEIKKSKSKEELTPKGETTPTAMSTEKPSEWSTDQQKQLETALKKYPASDTERWDKISAAVTGKSKQECIARFKEIREAILKKKKASGTS